MEDECSMRVPRDISDQLSGLKQHPQESLDDVVRRLAAEAAGECDDPMKAWTSCPVYKLEVLWKDRSRESAE